MYVSIQNIIILFYWTPFDPMLFSLHFCGTQTLTLSPVWSCVVFVLLILLLIIFGYYGLFHYVVFKSLIRKGSILLNFR